MAVTPAHIKILFNGNGNGNGAKEVRHCLTCNSSWNLPPKSSEIKEGLTEGHLYCCDKNMQVTLNGQTFPRLAAIARGNAALCGPQGRYWTPVVEPKTFEPRSNDQSLRARSMFNRPARVAQAESQAEQPSDNKKKPAPSKPSPARRPYKVA